MDPLLSRLSLFQLCSCPAALSRSMILPSGDEDSDDYHELQRHGAQSLEDPTEGHLSEVPGLDELVWTHGPL